MNHIIVRSILLTCLLTSSVWAGGGNLSSFYQDETTVNIPLVIDGKQASYHEKNKISVKVTSIRKGEYIEYDISPMAAEFKNVPEPRILTYLGMDINEDKSYQLRIMTFLCSGENPIGGDAFGDSLKRIADPDSEQTDIDIFIATGGAAQDIQVAQAKKARAKVFDQFLKVYEERVGMDISLDQNASNIYIPSIVAGTSAETITAIQRSLYSAFFSRVNASINGCSKKFLMEMKDHLIENVVKAKPFADIEIKKKLLTNQYKLKTILK